MEYKAYLKQFGEGCDYTIGCGQRIITIDASNLEEAKEKLFREIEDNYTDERALESCELYEINQVVVCDLKECYKRIDDVFHKEQQAIEEEFERKEFERLKEKFENK